MAINLTSVPWSSALSARLDALGIRVWFERGVCYAEDEAVAQAAIDAFTLDQAKDGVIAEIDAHAKALRDQVVAPYSAAEMASWPIKLQEARGAKSSEILAAEATARGITEVELVTKVEAKAAAFMAVEGAIAGTAGKHQDAVNALRSHAAVAAYNWREGWPL